MWQLYFRIFSYNYFLFFFFFFSSRRRHTRLQGDWSSDVCSSDLKLYNIVKDSAGAEKEYDRALAIYEHAWKAGDPRFIDALNHVADYADGALGEIGRASCRERG